MSFQPVKTVQCHEARSISSAAHFFVTWDVISRLLSAIFKRGGRSELLSNRKCVCGGGGRITSSQGITKVYKQCHFFFSFNPQSVFEEFWQSRIFMAQLQSNTALWVNAVWEWINPTSDTVPYFWKWIKSWSWWEMLHVDHPVTINFINLIFGSSSSYALDHTQVRWVR